MSVRASDRDFMVRSRSNRRHVRFLIDRWAKRSHMKYGVWTYEDQSGFSSVRSFAVLGIPPAVSYSPLCAWGWMNVPPCAVARAIALALSHVRTARLTLRHARAIDQAHTPPVFGVAASSCVESRALSPSHFTSGKATAAELSEAASHPRSEKRAQTDWHWRCSGGGTQGVR